MTAQGGDAEPCVTPQQRSGDHYFSASPDTPSRPSTVRLDLPDRSLQLRTDRGVFSPDRVDPGTKLLLMELPPLEVGPVLDLGCGYGAIACTVALRHPDLEVVALDVNERALELCRMNAAELGARVRVLAAPADEVTTVGTIVSNPPIRIGKAALHDLLARWLERLDPTGCAHLVVHKNLGADSLARWLSGRGHAVERRCSRQGYRVLDVHPA